MKHLEKLAIAFLLLNGVSCKAPEKYFDPKPSGSNPRSNQNLISHGETILNGQTPLMPHPCDLLSPRTLGPVRLSDTAEKKLGDLVSSSHKLSQNAYDKMLTLEASPMFSIRSKVDPAILFAWHGNRFLGQNALYANERAGDLWEQIVRIALSNDSEEKKQSDVTAAIERF